MLVLRGLSGAAEKEKTAPVTLSGEKEGRSICRIVLDG